MALKIGFTNKYFTLWNVKTETTYYQPINGKSYPNFHYTHYTYHQNLSFDKDKAIEKAKEKGCTDLVVDEELRGKRGSWTKREYVVLPTKVYEPYEFHFGKLHRKDIRECYEYSYMKWFYNEGQYTSDEQKKILEDRIIEMGNGEMVMYNGELMTEEAMTNLVNFDKYEKFITENGYLDIFIKRNCDEEGRLFAGVNVHFPKTKENYYNGYQYYLPSFDGKAVRIKNKEVRLYFSEKIEDFWEVRGIKILKKTTK